MRPSTRCGPQSCGRGKLRRVPAIRLVLRLAVFAAVVFALVTYVALEGGDVAILRTHGTDRSFRDTHVWWVDGENGSLWLEAATPDRPWLLDVQHDAQVELTRGEDEDPLRAVPVEGDAARHDVRERMHEKYGWADSWVGLLQDTSTAVAVRLDPK